MPERKHRVVPDKRTQSFEQTPEEVPQSNSKSKKKKKKKESKKSSRGESQAQGGIGDLLDLGGFSSVSEASTPQPVQAAASAMQSQNNAISSAFDDLLGFSDPAPVPQLAGAAPALTAGPSPASDPFGEMTMGNSVQQAAPSAPPAESLGKSTKRPWIRGTIKTSHASGSPIVDWSKVQLFFRVYKSSGNGAVAASVAVKVFNYMETSSMNGLTLNIKDFGDVSIGDVTPGGAGESSKVGPFTFPAPDSPLELKGTLTIADCHVPVKLHLPVSMHFAPSDGLALEDVAQQLSSPHWSSLSSKLPISGGSEYVKQHIANFLRLAEVEPHLSGPANGTFAAQSISSGAQIRLLAKVKKDKVKIDVKTSNPQLGEKIISDLKRLVL